MDEPSRGIDIGAKTEVFDIINQYAERGLSIIVVSSELQETTMIEDVYKRQRQERFLSDC